MTDSPWSSVRAKYLFTEVDNRAGDLRLPLLSVSVYRGVIPRSELTTTEARADDLSIYKTCDTDDIVVNRMSAYQGAAGIARAPGLVSPDYMVLRTSQGVEPRFFSHLTRSSWFTGQIKRRLRGIGSPDQGNVRTPRINVEELGEIIVRIPNGRLQRQIADFLDGETVRIDALVAKKRRLINLLEEQWSATLEMAIGGGWASGLILQGKDVEVPGGWRVRKLLHLLDPSIPLVYGILLPGPRLSEGVAYIGAGDVTVDRLHLELLPRTTEEIAAEYPRSRMRSGEIVYAIRGSFGAVEQIPPELDGVNLSRDAARIAPSSAISGSWLTFALKSHTAQEQFLRKEVGATITGVNIGDLKQVRLPVPPRESQELLTGHLKARRSVVNKTIGALGTQISLLQEHRQALITAAVTGETEVPSRYRRDIAGRADAVDVGAARGEAGGSA